MLDTLDLAAFRCAPLSRVPFQYVIVPGFIKAHARPAIIADYPHIEHAGSYPVEELVYGPAFRSLITTLQGPEVRAVFEEKFGIDLTDRPTMITVRGRCGTKDGTIHTDAPSKIITALIYMNPEWEEAGGRLRLLRSAFDIDDVIVEVPPMEGTLVSFRRSDVSFHGHKPFIGPRQVVQLNWVTSQLLKTREIARHRMSAWLKKLLPLGRFPGIKSEEIDRSPVSG
jgi:SM-20-related protein